MGGERWNEMMHGWDFIAADGVRMFRPGNPPPLTDEEIKAQRVAALQRQMKIEERAAKALMPFKMYALAYVFAVLAVVLIALL